MCSGEEVCGLTSVKENGNMVIVTVGGFSILMQILSRFYGGNLFMVLCIVSTFATLFSFAWFKLVLLDGFVHSFWLKRRMSKGLKCIYGYGIDEFFVLSRFGFIVGSLAVLILIVNCCNGSLAFEGACVEGVICVGVFAVYCIQLEKYDGPFNGIVIPFMASCLGCVVAAIFCMYSWWIVGLGLFFVYCVIVCLKEIDGSVRKLVWGDHAIVRVGNKVFDSSQERFYLIFYGESKVTLVLQEDDILRCRSVDQVVCIDRLPKASDGIDGWEDLTPVWKRVVERVMGLRVF